MVALVRLRTVCFFAILALMPLMASCVCVAPRFATSTFCTSDFECGSGMRCVAGQCQHVQQNCTSGVSRTCFLGGTTSCQYGRQTCVNGSWEDCKASNVGQTKEVCDNVDNDCNGKIDESFPEQNQACIVPGAQGPCAKGTYTACRSGTLVCSSSSQSQPEGPTYGNCNDGIDNDCDGFIDDPARDNCSSCQTGQKQKCYPFGQGVNDSTVGKGACKVGERICLSGQWQACQGAITPVKEICGDKIDNDCNGLADDNCDQKCDPIGSQGPCYSGPEATKNVGTCRTGVQVCQANGTWGACKDEILPTKEICDDKLDNDCNGKIDDCGQTECQSGQTRPCYTGPAGTDGKGPCKKGTEACSPDGKWSQKCTGEVVPTKENCSDGIDNNCNGQVDDCQIKDMLSASWDKQDPVKLWDTTTDKNTRSYSGVHTDTVYSARFSTDGSTLFTSGHDKRVVAWDVNSGKVLWQKTDHTDAVHSLSVHPAGALLASGGADTTIRIYNTKTGTSTVAKGHTGAVYGLAYGPAGKFLASGSADSTVRIWDASANPKTIHTLKGHTLEIFSLAYHPKGNMVASGSRDTSVILWEPNTGTKIQTLSKHTKSVTALAFSADGKWLASGAADTTINLWDLSVKPIKLVRTITQTGQSAIYALAFHPTTHTLVSGAYSGTIAFWDPNTGKELKKYPAHSNPVSALDFRP